MEKIKYNFLIALLIYLPLQKLLAAVLSLWLAGDYVFWLTHWYEPLLLLWLVVVALGCVTGRRCINFRALNQPAAFFVLLAAVSALFLAGDLGRGIEGFRFTALPVLFFLLLEISSLSKEKRDGLFSVYLIMALLVAVWGLLERFLPINYWSALGLNNFGWGKYNLVEKYYQSASLMDGPNQLAAYLLPAIFIVVSKLFVSKKDKPMRAIGAVIIMISALFLTFSRSALLALLIVALIYLLCGKLQRKAKLLIVTLALLTTTAAWVVVGRSPEKLDTLVYHGASQIEHNNALSETWKIIKARSWDQKIIGSGIGSAGPAALKYGDGVISESWYLQLVLELGLLGLGLWLWLIVDLFLKLFKSNELGLAFALLAISVAALFLHTWADNPALAITMFVFMGTLKSNRLLNAR